jgi:epoxyqueuosine reductase
MAKFDQKFLEEMKKKLGVELLGVASVNASKELKKQAGGLLPGARSVVVLGKEVFKEVVDQLQAGKEVGEAIAADFMGPHSEFLGGRLTKAVYDLAANLRKEGYRCFPLPSIGSPVDQRFLKPIFSFKQAAVLAGIGTLGWHTLVITPEYGARVRFACLLTDAPLEASPVPKKNYCLQCNACIRICPAGALQKPKKGEHAAMNPFACRTYRGVGITCSLCLKACDAVHSGKRKGPRGVKREQGRGKG